MDAISLESSLQRWFGWQAFLPGQREVLDNLLAGRSAAAVFPTGGGKSLCYQLPALLWDGVTLVVSPLIALMKDQIDALQARGIAARRLDSTLTAEAYREVMDELRSGRLRLLYVSPERFNNERFRLALLNARIALFAVDEAHCISEWGHNFRPDYLKLAEFARQCGAARVLALTATATPAVLADICRELSIAPDCATCTGFYRSNLTLRTTVVTVGNRDVVLLDRLRARPAGPTIVYVSLQATAENVAARLRAAGWDARPYHAGMTDELRSATQDSFLQSTSGIIVATIAFGMGVDKRDIRYIYHYNMPKSLENYSQEIGRAGRDRAASICEMLVCRDDVQVLENFAYGDTPTEQAMRDFVEAIAQQGSEVDLSQYELAGATDIRLLVVRTLLTYLELLGYLEGGTPYYSSYRFQPLVSSAEILARFEGERQQFLKRVFQSARKAKHWFHIDVAQTAAACGVPRERVVRALDYLAEQQLLELSVQGVRHRYRRLREFSDPAGLAGELRAKTLAREQRELARLQEVLDLVTHDGCQVARLCTHFGDQLRSPCGHCNWCLEGRQPVRLPPPSFAQVDPGVLAEAGALRYQYPFLGDPQVLARFLCGITSPRFTKTRLSGHSLFGAAAHVAYPTVRTAVAQL